MSPRTVKSERKIGHLAGPRWYACPPLVRAVSVTAALAASGFLQGCPMAPPYKADSVFVRDSVPGAAGTWIYGARSVLVRDSSYGAYAESLRPWPSSECPNQFDSEADRMVCAMIDATAAFNVPKHLPLDAQAVVVLVLHRKLSDQELVGVVEKAISDTGAHVETRRVKTTDLMSAKLEGQAFEITPSDAPPRLVATMDTVVWQWEVTPRRSGKQWLVLTLTAHIRSPSQDSPARPYVVLRREIDVWVTIGKRIEQLADLAVKYWVLILAFLAFAGGVIRWRTSRKRRQAGF